MSILKPEDQQRLDWVKVFYRIPEMMFERVENKIGCGTPDMAYCINGINGWIEFKVQTKGPASMHLKNITVEHWLGLQREWMRQRYLSPTIFLFLRIGDLDFIFDVHTMFRFEEKTLGYLIDNHKWIYRMEGQKWSPLMLEVLKQKLLGVEIIRTKEEISNV